MKPKRKRQYGEVDYWESMSDILVGLLLCILLIVLLLILYLLRVPDNENVDDRYGSSYATHYDPNYGGGNRMITMTMTKNSMSMTRMTATVVAAAAMAARGRMIPVNTTIPTPAQAKGQAWIRRPFMCRWWTVKQVRPSSGRGWSMSFIPTMMFSRR